MGTNRDDKRLDRLYDYTKFHIGIYLSAGGALAALISTAADREKTSFISRLVGAPWALGVAFLFLVFAGAAGAIVATSAIESATFSDFSRLRTGAHGMRPFRGLTWVRIEHACFWISLLFLAIGVLSSRKVLAWLLSLQPCT